MRSPTGVIDGLAAAVPDNVWLKAPVSDDTGQITWEDITWRQLSRAVNAMAHWIDANFDPASSKAEPIAYMGINDIRYPIVMFAALKTGHASLLTSPRNSQEGHLSLLSRTTCKKFLFTKEFQGQVDDLTAKAGEVKALRVPEIEELLDARSEDKAYPSQCGTEMEDQDIAIILHSSGTTGLPRPIWIKAGVFGVIDKLLEMPAPEGRRNSHDEFLGTRLSLIMMPFFHAFGINMLARSIYHQGPLVLLPAGRPPTAQFLMEAIAKTKPSSLVCAASMLEELCNTPHGLETISTLDSVLYGGAPLARAVGDKVTKVTMLINGMGSTEAFYEVNYIPADPADWDYFEWNPLAGLVVEPVDGNPRQGELVIKRTPDGKWTFVFHNFPELDEWRTKDLFELHPAKPALWRYIGRVDDVIVLSNAEKLNPVSFEKVLEGDPRVGGAIVVGSGRFQTGLMIEPHDADEAGRDPDGFIDELWPVIEEANAQYPSHARVWREMVLLATPEKPFKRAGKGSVLRRATCELYAEEIEGLYARQAALDGPEVDGVDGVGGTESIKAVVGEAVRSALRGQKDGLSDEANIFTLGADSLQVLQLSQVLGRKFRNIGSTEVFRMIYENPSIERLTTAIAEVSTSTSSSNTPQRVVVSREEKMSAMIHRYTRDLQKKKKGIAINGTTSSLPTSQGTTVILTGSTGSLGSYLLHQLIISPSIVHIYALNRTSDAPERQERSFQARGLDPAGLSSSGHPKVTFLAADLSQDRFGLDPAVYTQLLSETNLLIHNAWPVNFNSPLESFEPAVAGTRKIVDFASEAVHHPHVVFISSVASVLNYPAVRPLENSSGDEDSTLLLIPEEFEPDNSLPIRQGYGESKHVASSVLDKAARVAGLRATVLRAGQLAGPVEGGGVWGRQEWLPSLIATSKTLGKIPRSLGPQNDDLDWLPVDLAAQAVLDISQSRLEDKQGASSSNGSTGLECYNLVNPQIGKWSDMVGAVQGFYAREGGDKASAIEVVELVEWLAALEAVGADLGEGGAELVKQYPALKLLDFFQGMAAGEDGDVSKVRFVTDGAVGRSQTMRGLKAVDEEMMGRWLESWGF
ncbi:hypothetical protein B0T17DRAFT_620136 [Bombardia bombarda]|uniref:Carrier domain-containing protein n=1 Tax=Bombardia bombarda TaxID=252184 RepID=A0AA39WH86_9PEZI|nr:hypothetical protein B0T17DRAFT_620136 [Bombardia bombarda]